MIIANLLNALLISVLVIVGLIVLMAMHVVSPAVGVPLIGTLAGVHIPAPSTTPVGPSTDPTSPGGTTPTAGGRPLE